MNCSSFLGNNNIPIFYCILRAENPRAKILLCTGYNESYLKYTECIQDLCRRGFSVYCYDHRGQGLSGRFEGQKNRGFVDSFSSLVSDFSTFYTLVLEDAENILPVFVLAHSMGGTIVTLAAAQIKFQNLCGIILTSPMFEIKMSPFSFLELPFLWIATFFTKIGFEKEYAFGRGDCVPLLPFEENEVTHSELRFSAWRKMISENSQLQLGGPTFSWVAQAISASRLAREIGSKIHIPLLLLQAGEDSIVVNRAQNDFIKQVPQGKLNVFEHAKHEILMEIDEIRDQAFVEIEKFIEAPSEHLNLYLSDTECFLCTFQ